MHQAGRGTQPHRLMLPCPMKLLHLLNHEDEIRVPVVCVRRHQGQKLDWKARTWGLPELLVDLQCLGVGWRGGGGAHCPPPNGRRLGKSLFVPTTWHNRISVITGLVLSFLPVRSVQSNVSVLHLNRVRVIMPCQRGVISHYSAECTEAEYRKFREWGQGIYHTYHGSQMTWV